jgi:hypothetical protein
LVLGLSVATACGGGDGGRSGPPEDWAVTVCGEVAGALGDLETALAVIEELPTDVAADAPLGGRARDLRLAFLALPEYIERYLAVVEATPAPDTPDGEAFRDELLADLRSAEETFGAAARRARTLRAETTVEEFFGGVEDFAGFPEAFAASDLDFGEDVPPGVGEAVTADTTCRDAQNRLVALLAP